ncbi:MAG: hypothetical protein H0U75_02070 [Legionella sp.]|nr:hypothetical protein [Legionella sp.]
MTLENVMTALINIITSYYQLKTGKDISATLLENIKDTRYRYKSLTTCILKATSNTNTRAPLLNYFSLVIETICPIIDKKLKLTDGEETLISEILVPLISTCQELMTTSNAAYLYLPYHQAVLDTLSTLPSHQIISGGFESKLEEDTSSQEFLKINLTYNEAYSNKHYGFIGGWPFGSTGSIAQIVNLHLLEPFYKPSPDPKSAISGLIESYQNPFKLSCLSQKVTELEKTILALSQDKLTLTEELKVSKEQFRESQLKLAVYENTAEKKLSYQAALLSSKGSSPQEKKSSIAHLTATTTTVCKNSAKAGSVLPKFTLFHPQKNQLNHEKGPESSLASKAIHLAANAVTVTAIMSEKTSDISLNLGH